MEISFLEEQQSRGLRSFWFKRFNLKFKSRARTTYIAISFYLILFILYIIYIYIVSSRTIK